MATGQAADTDRIDAYDQIATVLDLYVTKTFEHVGGEPPAEG